MIAAAKPRTILMADDDPEDCILAQDALTHAGLPHQVRPVGDGAELIRYLTGRPTPRYPDLILLDLNMPRQSGRETLPELKSNPHLQRIPVVVLTTSSSPDDVVYCYRMGANSFVSKPVSFRAWVDLITTLSKYWFETVQLPCGEGHG